MYLVDNKSCTNALVYVHRALLHYSCAIAHDERFFYSFFTIFAGFRCIISYIL